MAIWIANFISFLFCIEPAKKFDGVTTLTVEPFSSPYTSQCPFSWTTPPPFELTYFMDDPYMFPGRYKKIVSLYRSYEKSIPDVIQSNSKQINTKIEKTIWTNKGPERKPYSKSRPNRQKTWEAQRRNQKVEETYFILNKSFERLKDFLNELKNNLNVIALTETWSSDDKVKKDYWRKRASNHKGCRIGSSCLFMIFRFQNL